METTVNDRIKMIINDESMTINQFAKKIEISQPTLKAIVDGKTKPSYETISKICIVFTISPNWLILAIGNKKLTDLLIEEEKPEREPENKLMMKTIIELSGKNAVLEAKLIEYEKERGYKLAAEPIKKYGK